MSDFEKNLAVLTDHVRWLSSKQRAAAGRITVANQSVRDTASSMWSSHGIVCAPTNMAVAAAQSARAEAGATLHKISEELATRLTDAADNYDDADYRSGDNIGACGL
ncbi:MAG: ESX-1 secretion-associated protein [Mycolicibacterium rufum]|uniref:ESX-1 secretion-associated protein n=1 Tax=Mycolicibacterium chlorophenolicum TaxID=37916 RepID=A0A0J6VIT6_9MYCO|nr:type VII secretion target [Mycolicibacterium chlorophenolicum]KMO70179.1 hypothetical protein MCHLDSM_05067 [Mycolicibacterium chlorophenolicum]MBI5338503.1 ESX-1 secretion-associated protein [Mycolicibacterium rufum]